MIPTIDRRATGINIRRIMDRRGISVKDLQRYLGLGSIQSIYHWLNGICLPSLDNLYAMSRYFRLPLDALICGSEPRLSAYRTASFLWERHTLTQLAMCADVRLKFYSL